MDVNQMKGGSLHFNLIIHCLISNKFNVLEYRAKRPENMYRFFTLNNIAMTNLQNEGKS